MGMAIQEGEKIAEKVTINHLKLNKEAT